MIPDKTAIYWNLIYKLQDLMRQIVIYPDQEELRRIRRNGGCEASGVGRSPTGHLQKYSGPSCYHVHLSYRPSSSLRPFPTGGVLWNTHQIIKPHFLSSCFSFYHDKYANYLSRLYGNWHIRRWGCGGKLRRLLFNTSVKGITISQIGIMPKHLNRTPRCFYLCAL